MTEIIKISNGTKTEFDNLTTDTGYDKIISKLLQLIPTGDDECKYIIELCLELLSTKLEVIDGNTLDHAKVKKILGFID